MIARLGEVDVGILVAEPDGTLSYATAPVSRLFGMPLRTFQAKAKVYKLRQKDRP